MGFWTWQARRGRVRSGPWALSGTSQAGGEAAEAGWQEGGAPMVPGLQGLQVSSGQDSEIC